MANTSYQAEQKQEGTYLERKKEKKPWIWEYQAMAIKYESLSMRQIILENWKPLFIACSQHVFGFMPCRTWVACMNHVAKFTTRFYVTDMTADDIWHTWILTVISYWNEPIILILLLFVPTGHIRFKHVQIMKYCEIQTLTVDMDLLSSLFKIALCTEQLIISEYARSHLRADEFPGLKFFHPMKCLNTLSFFEKGVGHSKHWKNKRTISIHSSYLT